MSDWIHKLPLVWMAVVIFGFTYLLAAAIYAVVMVLADGERMRSFKAVSPGMLPPLGILFALFVAFTASQVWTDTDKANTAVNREASSLRTVVLLASSFSGEPKSHLRALIRNYIQDTTTREWPMMADQNAALGFTPSQLAEVMQLTLDLVPSTDGQRTAQREITTQLDNALDARRQRVIISRSQVNLVKWLCILLQAICALIAIAMVHSENRLTSAMSMAIFATGVATSLLLIASHDRPFAGATSVSPAPLLQAMPVTVSAQQ